MAQTTIDPKRKSRIAAQGKSHCALLPTYPCHQAEAQLPGGGCAFVSGPRPLKIFGTTNKP
jgi:hypothetical protein